MDYTDEPIYPDPMRGAEQSYTNQTPNDLPTGLSKREYFAGLAMQGLIAGRWACPDNVPNDVETITREALLHADELLKQLKNTK
ncbi:hypothetical protein BAS10_07410 [Elizabethkingia meningoseptica]|uniref:hypothetical protein n=1 Tax=Elizabethkingia meningoseptica TaxID=238 RepID=UPI00099A0AAE|nr:hypothetical protein [Elizabethkingia meningoseptica]OPB96868.1 hypothetical protein BAS10_07410 [Elizabethkingia meningoseptica]